MSRKWIGFAVFAVVMLAIPLVPGIPDYWVTLLDFVGVASLVSLGLVLLTGVGGMTSFGQAAFVGFGAYATALLTTAYGWSPWMALFASIALTAFAALIIGLVTVRLSGHFLPLGTIAWGISFYYLFGNLKIIGAYDGIQGVPPLTFFGTELLSGRAFYPVIWVMVLAAIALTLNLLDSRVGRAIRALRSGAAAAESVGINIWTAKLAVFVYAAVLAGVAGWLYAHFQRAVTPGAFGLNVGIEYLLMAVVGGAGHVYGAVLGAGIVTILKDLLQDWLPLVFGQGGNYEGIVFGIFLVALLQGARTGFWPLIAGLFPKGSPRAITAAPPLPHDATSPEDPLLEVRAARKTFGGLVAVNDMSFRVRPGEIVGLIGPNGAGKSTTFNLVTGVTRLTAGEIVFRDKTVTGLAPARIAKRRIARTFQHVKLSPAMTVLDNVAIGTHLRSRSGFFTGMLALDRSEEKRIFAEAARQLERVGLKDRMHIEAGALSLGEQRLAEIARALCLDPVLLLLDEPAAGLRHSEKQALAKLIEDLRDDGMSVLLVEHDMDFVMRLTNHIVVLDFGSKIAEGPPAEVRKNPAVIEAYLGADL